MDLHSAAGHAPHQEAGRIILGIDPGTTVMGFGVIRSKAGKVSLLAADAIRFPAGDDHTVKLRAIFGHVVRIIQEYRPHELAIEAQFFGKNVQSMLKLGRAQGVAIAAALHCGLPVAEHAPKRVKQSITGNGNATKEQVAAMLCTLLDLRELPASTDATDALAVALCHLFAQSGSPRPAARGASRKGGDWGAFIRNNPGRVKG